MHRLMTITLLMAALLSAAPAWGKPWDVRHDISKGAREVRHDVKKARKEIRNIDHHWDHMRHEVRDVGRDARREARDIRHDVRREAKDIRHDVRREVRKLR